MIFADEFRSYCCTQQYTTQDSICDIVLLVLILVVDTRKVIWIWNKGAGKQSVYLLGSSVSIAITHTYRKISVYIMLLFEYFPSYSSSCAPKAHFPWHGINFSIGTNPIPALISWNISPLFHDCHLSQSALRKCQKPLRPMAFGSYPIWHVTTTLCGVSVFHCVLCMVYGLSSLNTGATGAAPTLYNRLNRLIQAFFSNTSESVAKALCGSVALFKNN